ncbi:MAG: hypothetical protein IPH49_05665 [Ignavibacteria bacterium]|nr:hypothetical protein [Ignavibacteria bacterium]
MKTIALLLLMSVIPGYAQWDTVKTNSTRTFYGIDVLENKIWIAGLNYRMSSDSGSTMDSIPINPRGAVVKFRDSLNGVMIGPDTIYNSSDGGNTWMKSPKRSPELHDIIYNGTGYVATGPRKTFGFSKDGQFWTFFQAYDPLKTHSWIEFYSLAFLDSLNGCAVGDSGVIALTDDGGETWTISHSGPFWNIFGITTVDGKYLASASRGDLLLSLDKGKTWSSAGKLGNKDLIDIAFINENVGYVLGQGIIYRTKDAGRTWKSQQVHKDIRKIAFSSEFLGYGIGINGRMIRTTSGGENISISSEQSTKQVCSGNQVRFSLNTDGTSAPYTYKWYLLDGSIPTSWIVAGGVSESTVTIVPTSRSDVYVHVVNGYRADTVLKFSYDYTQSPQATIRLKSPDTLEVMVEIPNLRLDYQWFIVNSDNWRPINERRNRTFSPGQPGVYAAEVYNHDSRCHFRTEPFEYLATSLDNVNYDDDVEIVLSSDAITVSNWSSREIEYRLMASTGQIVLHGVAGVSQLNRLDLSAFPSGIYFFVGRAGSFGVYRPFVFFR